MYKDIKELERDGYKYHHTSWTQGYVSRKKDVTRIYKYSGRFGTGYIVEHPAWTSTRYHYISYYIREEATA